MIQMSGSAWRTQGSTLVVRIDSIAELLRDATAGTGVRLVSLREVLGWSAASWPADLPGVESVVVHGVSALLDRSDRDGASAFVRRTMKHIIRTAQSHWTATGLLFLLPVQPGRIRVDLDDQLQYRLPNGDDVPLSRNLWNGASHDVREVTCTVPKGTEAVGYHVARLS